MQWQVEPPPKEKEFICDMVATNVRGSLLKQKYETFEGGTVTIRKSI